MIIKCEKCKISLEEQLMCEHHILPREVRKNNVSIKHGKKLWLCQKCHDEIHSLLPNIVTEFTMGWLNGI